LVKLLPLLTGSLSSKAGKSVLVCDLTPKAIPPVVGLIKKNLTSTLYDVPFRRAEVALSDPKSWGSSEKIFNPSDANLVAAEVELVGVEQLRAPAAQVLS